MHYDIAEWSDFVRGLVSAGQREVMRRHLASGCGKCRRVADMLGKVTELAAADSRYEVPEYAVHCARAIFALEQPRQVRILPGLIGRLVFDSFREPLPAGVRSHHHISRQTLFEAGDYSVDVRQEHERGSARVTMVGQVASRKEPGQALAGVPVVLYSGNSVLARTVSTRYGEFHLEYAPARDLRLEVGAERVQGATGAGRWSGNKGGLE